MVWNNSLNTGNQRVDQEHKELFNMVTKMLELDTDQIGDKHLAERKGKIENAVKFMGDYTVKHFAHEEELMTECKYPSKAEHVAEHKAFFPVFEDLKKKILDEGATLAISLEVNSVLVKWLTNHIMNSDKKLAAHYKSTTGKN